MRTTIPANVVGMKYYGLSPTAAAQLLKVPPSLIREPHNSHDTNAIAVTVEGRTVGHIDRRSAAIMAPLMDSGTPFTIEIGPIAGQAISAKCSFTQSVRHVPAPQICRANTAGIYIICADNLDYVGQSRDIQNRIRQHWDELQRGVHQNPQLRALWRELGASKFSAKVVEIAPPLTRSLDIARWLHAGEQRWIEACGGMRKVVNVDIPKPVLDAAAKTELEHERLVNASRLHELERHYQDLLGTEESLRSSIEAAKIAISKAERFWGIFNSAAVSRDADKARRDIVRLGDKVSEVASKKQVIRKALYDLKSHLLM